MNDPFVEMNVIYDNLLNKCNVSIPRRLTRLEILNFTENRLRHHHSDHIYNLCTLDESSLNDITPSPSFWDTQNPSDL